MRKLLLLFLLFLITSAGFAQKKKIIKPDGQLLSIETIDRVVKKLMDTAEVTGLCLGIINENKIVYVKGYGYKNKLRQQWNDTATCFYAASLAKSLFAYLVMRLVDEELIDLDKPLYTYLPKPLPEYEKYKDLAGDERWKLITARNCLTHTTGFPNWRFLNPRGNEKLEIFFTPGTRYAYSGEGLYLLQMVVETITGKQLEDLAQEKIFKPFGMRRTSFLWQPSFETDYAVGHNFNEDSIRKNKRKTANAAGSMETTIADYTRFIEAVTRGKDISIKSKQEMISPQIPIYSKRQFPSLNTDTTNQNKSIQLSYGLGWGLFTSPYGKVFFKEGHDDGWQHYTICFPEKKSAFVIMTNSDNGESIFKEMVEKPTGVTIPWQWEGYFPYRGTIKLPEEYLRQFIGVYKGEMDVTITLENGRLKAEASSVGLPKTNLYSENDHHFFLKIMAADVDFIKSADGKVVKMLVDDEGKHYELVKADKL